MIFSKLQQQEAYRRMLRIRKFEEEGTRLYVADKIPGAYHASIGQEAFHGGRRPRLCRESVRRG